MPKLTLNTIGSRYGSIDALNDNFDAIEAAVENTLSLDGTTPNEMQADLSMGGNDILNVGTLNGFNVTALGPDINTVVTNIADINTVASNIADVSAVAAIDGDVTIAANNVADITNFADVYLGARAADPTTRTDGSPLQQGDLYFNTVENALRAYSGTQWVAGTAGTISVTTFSGDDVTTVFNLPTAPVSENNTQVYIGGVYQNKDTYSVSGTTVTFSEAPVTGTDNIEVVQIATLSIGETDANLVSYTPAGTGAVATNVQSKLREFVSVKDFGAVGDGVTDDTAAIQAAIAAAASYSATSTLTEISRKTVFFPAGVYKVTGPLTAAVAGGTTYTSFVGENAIISQAAGVTAFNGIGTMVSFKGLMFQGGAGAIAISTNNTDASLITIDRCSFLNWTGNCLSVGALSTGGTQLVVNNSRFMIPLGVTAGSSRVLYAEPCDEVTFNDCCVSHKSSNATFFSQAAALRLNRLLGVPMPEAPGTGPAVLPAWIDSSGSVYCNDCRFGGEGGGPTAAIIRNYASSDITAPVTPTVVSIKGGVAYVAAGGTLLSLFAIPNVIEIVGVTGLVSVSPLRVDSSVPSSDTAALGNGASIIKIEYNSEQYSAYVNPLTGAPTIARELIPRVADRHVLSSKPLVADLVYQTQVNTGAYGPTYSGANVTGGMVADDLGVSGLEITATADSAFFAQNFTTALSGLAAGLYTAIFDVVVDGNFTLRPLFKVATVQTQEFALAKGRHTICIPFYYESGISTNLGLEAYGMPNTAFIRFSKFKIIKGRVLMTDRRLELEGSGAPVSGQFYQGDVVYIPPVAGSFIGYVCTTAGTPGTWKTFGAITP